MVLVPELAAAGVAIRPRSEKQTQRDLVAAQSPVCVGCLFLCHGLTQLVNVCFLLRNYPSSSVLDLQCSTEGEDVDKRCEADTVTDTLPLLRLAAC